MVTSNKLKEVKEKGKRLQTHTQNDLEVKMI